MNEERIPLVLARSAHHRGAQWNFFVYFVLPRFTFVATDNRNFSHNRRPVLPDLGPDSVAFHRQASRFGELFVDSVGRFVRQRNAPYPARK